MRLGHGGRRTGLFPMKSLTIAQGESRKKVEKSGGSPGRLLRFDYDGNDRSGYSQFSELHKT